VLPYGCHAYTEFAQSYLVSGLASDPQIRCRPLSLDAGILVVSDSGCSTRSGVGRGDGCAKITSTGMERGYRSPDFTR
jgi:hypothetical protein